MMRGGNLTFITLPVWKKKLNKDFDYFCNETKTAVIVTNDIFSS
jgi:hypothetical protein